MSAPHLELIPSRPAVRADAPVTVDVLVKITTPEPEPSPGRPTRPPLNLGLVLDRSGSMAERNKLAFAREAAAFAVRELAPTDRVSVTTFDGRVETIAPNAPAADKARLVALIDGITPRGGTALHGGWAEGAAQVHAHLTAGGLNRVILLSDGLANVGESRPDAVATAVHARARDGVSTTTLGLGDEYNEDLLEAMARSGDGNYYYVESPAQLPGIFQTELHGLSATVGTDVTLTVEPGPGASVAEVLNGLDRTPDGRLRLSNLIAGLPVYVVVRINVPAGAGEVAVGRFRVEWAGAGVAGRQSAVASLTLPAAPGAAWEALAVNVEVLERAALLAVARAKKAATRASELGDRGAVRVWLDEAKRVLAVAPSTPEVEREAKALAALEVLLIHDEAKFRKTAKFESYTTILSRPIIIDPSRDTE